MPLYIGRKYMGNWGLKKNRSGGYELPGELLKCVRCFLHLLGLFLPSKVKICQCAGTPS